MGERRRGGGRRRGQRNGRWEGKSSKALEGEREPQRNKGERKKGEVGGGEQTRTGGRGAESDWPGHRLHLSLGSYFCMRSSHLGLSFLTCTVGIRKTTLQGFQRLRRKVCEVQSPIAHSRSVARVSGKSVVHGSF